MSHKRREESRKICWAGEEATSIPKSFVVFAKQAGGASLCGACNLGSSWKCQEKVRELLHAVPPHYLAGRGVDTLPLHVFVRIARQRKE